VIGKKILSLLELRGMKQKELAAKIGVSVVTISRYINQDRVPQLEILVRMAEVLDTTTDYLLNKSLNPNRSGTLSDTSQTGPVQLTAEEAGLIQFIRQSAFNLTSEQYKRKLEQIKLSVKFIEEMEKKK
jgi:transcriptional regulator with XRE-family HTH domain